MARAWSARDPRKRAQPTPQAGALAHPLVRLEHRAPRWACPRIVAERPLSSDRKQSVHALLKFLLDYPQVRG